MLPGASAHRIGGDRVPDCAFSWLTGYERAEGLAAVTGNIRLYAVDDAHVLGPSVVWLDGRLVTAAGLHPDYVARAARSHGLRDFTAVMAPPERLIPRDLDGPCYVPLPPAG